MSRVKKVKQEECKMISVNEAVKRLNAAGFTMFNANRLQAGLRQRIYPFGNAIKLTEYVYEIFPVLLDKWIKERSEDVEVNEVSAAAG